jgi:hypothetical protein
VQGVCWRRNHIDLASYSCLPPGMRDPASAGPNMELEIFSSGVLELASTQMLHNEGARGDCSHNLTFVLFRGVNFHLHQDRSQKGNEIMSTMLKRRREHGSEASRLGMKGAHDLRGCRTRDPIRKSHTHSLSQQPTKRLVALILYGTSCKTPTRSHSACADHSPP